MSDMSERTILVTGVGGQVGFELVRSLQGLGRIVALDRRALDLGNPAQVRAVLREVRPALIVNPAAYTAVDDAESEPASATLINEHAPALLAEEAKRLGAVLIHYSTDYVFDGSKATAYVEEDQAAPLNVYGATKLAGEQAIAQSSVAHMIFRTSWVYGLRGRNFLRTMRRLATERDRLTIVSDQHGAPTWSRTIADITAHVVARGMAGSEIDTGWWRERSGIYHLSAGGVTSWYEFALAIFELDPPPMLPEVVPIAGADYPVRAARPRNSQLSNEKLARVFGLRPPEWKDALRMCLAGV